MKEHATLKKKIMITILCVLALFIVAVSIAGLVESKREQVYDETTRIDQPISVSAISFEELDRVMQSEYPKYCKGMQLVKATAEIEFRGCIIQRGEASLTYYRYIDESMEGGNVETNECRFDLSTNTFLSVEHAFGSGRSIFVNDNTLTEKVTNTPLDQYVLHAPELADLQADGVYLLRVDGVYNWMNISLLTMKDQRLIYGETLTQWPENGKFAEREFSLK